MAGILIKNGRIWDGNRFLFADVLIRDGIIERIAPDLSDDGAYLFDAEGMLVTPGLVDIHVHMAGTEPDRYGIHPEMSAIPFGVTAVADAGGAHANGELVSTYLVKNVTFVRVDIRDNTPDFSVTEKKLAMYADQAIGLKAYFDAKSGHVRDIAPLERICAYAREKNMPLMVHSTGTPVPMARLLETLAPGDILTHAFHGGAHTAAEDHYESMAAAQKRGVVIDAGFAGHIHTDFGVLRGALEKGILPDTISTDITRASAYKRGGRYGMTMAMGMARVAGMEEADILRAVTSTPGKILGKGDRWGILQEGGCADVAVLQYGREPFSLTDAAGNTLASENSYRCKLTVANGNVVWRD